MATSVGGILCSTGNWRGGLRKPGREPANIYSGLHVGKVIYSSLSHNIPACRGVSRDFTVLPFASPHRNIVMLAVALISIRGGNRHTCVRGFITYQRHSHIFRRNSPEGVCSPSQILPHRRHRSTPQNDSNCKNQAIHSNLSKKSGWRLTKGWMWANTCLLWSITDFQS